MKLRLMATIRNFALVCGWMLVFCLTACSVDDKKQQAENFSGTLEPEKSVNSGQVEFSEISVSEETSNSEQIITADGQTEINSQKDEIMKMSVQVGDSTFTATLEKNTAAEAFAALMEDAPVVIQMSDYAGFEKVGSLGTELPGSNSQTTTQPGDIVLYNGNQIVIFYGSNSWSYTRLGKIDDLTGWEEALGSGNVTVAFSVN